MPRKSGKPKSREGHEGARTLKFVDVTRQYSDGYHDAEEEKSIRAYVMREFLWHKSEPEKPSAPAAMKDSMQDHVIRFRYAKRNVLRHNTAPAPSHHRKIAMSRQSELGNSAHDPYQNESLEQGDEAAAILRPTPSAESADVDLSPTHSLLSDVLGDTGCRDPFARLPVDTSTETQRMLHYCEWSSLNSSPFLEKVRTSSMHYVRLNAHYNITKLKTWHAIRAYIKGICRDWLT
jgi:hypothetical protein